MPFVAWGATISSCLLFLEHTVGFWSPRVLQPGKFRVFCGFLWGRFFVVLFCFGAGFERQFLCRAWLKTLMYSAVLWIIQVGRSREGLEIFPFQEKRKNNTKQKARGRSCWLGATLNGLVVLQLSGPN